MPFDPFFASNAKANAAGFPKHCESPEDLAEKARLKALPWAERRAKFRELMELKNKGVMISRGEYLFIQSYLNWTKTKKSGLGRWLEDRKKYCGGNVQSGAYSSGGGASGGTDWANRKATQYGHH